MAMFMTGGVLALKWAGRLPLVMGFSAGAVIGVAFFDLLPEAMHLDPKKISVWFKVPNFHMFGHKWRCHSPFSFHWMWGAGMTDGEDVEQNWDFTNGAASSTKMMGRGPRASSARASAGDLI